MILHEQHCRMTVKSILVGQVHSHHDDEHHHNECHYIGKHDDEHELYSTSSESDSSVSSHSEHRPLIKTSSLLKFQEPDVYGQIHPIETPELIAAAQEEFQYELSKLSKEQTHNMYVAEEKCPDITTTEFRLCFLRCDVYNPKLAAERYAKYWNKRVEILGLDRAFQPVTMSSLLDSERAIIESGLWNILPPANTTSSASNNENRPIIFIDPGKFSKAKMANTDCVRALCYYAHQLLKNVECQKRGVILIGYAKNAKPAEYDFDFGKLVLSSFKCFPLRLSAYHAINPPKVVRMMKPLADLLVGSRLKKRVLMHGGKQDSEIYEKLERKYAIPQAMLPTFVGGNYTIDPIKYVHEQIKAGK